MTDSTLRESPDAVSDDAIAAPVIHRNGAAAEPCIEVRVGYGAAATYVTVTLAAAASLIEQLSIAYDQAAPLREGPDD